MQWIKAMDAINDENDFILTKAENTKTSKYLNVENVEHIVETKLNNFVTMNNNNGDAQTADEWNEIATLVKDETAGLAKAEENGNVQAKEMKELEQFIHQLRAKFLSENSVSLIFPYLGLNHIHIHTLLYCSFLSYNMYCFY